MKYFTTIIAAAKSEPGRQERETDTIYLWGGGGQYLRMSGLKRGVGGFVFGLRGCGSMVSRGSQGEVRGGSYQGYHSDLMREPLRHDPTIGDDSTVLSHRSDR